MLTEIACKAAACPADKLRSRFTDAGGLYLEVSPSGSKRWFWKYRFDAKEKWAAAGFKDTLLRCQMKREVTNEAEKEIQPRVQA